MVEGSCWWCVLPPLFQGSEYFFDGVEVWRIGRQVEHMEGRGFHDFACFWRFVEGGVVEDDGGVFRQFLEQMLSQPAIEPLCIG